MHAMTGRNGFVQIQGNQLELDAQPFAIGGVNLWARSGDGVPVAPTGAQWCAGTSLGGDNGLENQGLNSLYSTDQSTLPLLGDLNRDLARHRPSAPQFSTQP